MVATEVPYEILGPVWVLRGCGRSPRSCIAIGVNLDGILWTQRLIQRAWLWAKCGVHRQQVSGRGPLWAAPRKIKFSPEMTCFDESWAVIFEYLGRGEIALRHTRFVTESSNNVRGPRCSGNISRRTLRWLSGSSAQIVWGNRPNLPLPEATPLHDHIRTRRNILPDVTPVMSLVIGFSLSLRNATKIGFCRQSKCKYTQLHPRFSWCCCLI